MKFQPGHSGNPAGRPPGARNKKTIAAEELLGEKAKAMVERIIFLAEGGHPMALRLCMEAVMPKGADRPLALELPHVRCADDADAAFDIIIDAFGRGTLSTREFNHMLAAVGRMARTTHQIQDLRERERDRPGRKWELHPSMLPHPVPDPLEDALRAADGLADVALHPPVNSGASASPEEASPDAATGTDETGDGLYFPVNAAESGAPEAAPSSPAPPGRDAEPALDEGTAAIAGLGRATSPPGRAAAPR